VIGLFYFEWASWERWERCGELIWRRGGGTDHDAEEIAWAFQNRGGESLDGAVAPDWVPAFWKSMTILRCESSLLEAG